MHLICNATGGSKAPSEIDWFFKGNPITEADPRVQILKHRPIPGRWFISELVIERVVLADRGDYACRSSDNIIKGMKVHVLNGKTNGKWLAFIQYACCILFFFILVYSIFI